MDTIQEEFQYKKKNSKIQVFDNSLSPRMKSIVKNLTAPHRHKNIYCRQCMILDDTEEFSAKYNLGNKYKTSDLDSFVNNIKLLNQQLYDEYNQEISRDGRQSKNGS